ncbi:uracil-DNA glycosylase [Treponema brennaborense]|uniref:Type-4 uracil-DNA glycosylase n=1 Tax=Treponema brennaborense (strain DSM 12168 / CIP 105900 / DD5/3) TaxID=906968 RepID=F4LL02_TREBD|nr:uracil-DNA glycosylase [Treponema brennaborense]AEE16599.1 phage SPO1 DNA polymerase-related protein [Treponema brennaborense DSM 12168]
MTAGEKQTFYQLLKTADRWIRGYPSAVFTAPQPVFGDDVRVLPPQPSVRAAVAADTLPETAAALERIVQKIAGCTRCQLCKTRKNTVPGIGVPNPAVMVIGEGPGADEDASGIPFVGRAGQLLDKMLASISLSRTTNCYIANIVKCRPPGNRDPLPEESEACAAFLEAQISLLKPAAILAVGRVAAQNLLKTTVGIGKLRGKFTEYNGIPFLATYHPSALLRNEDLKRPAWEDLKLFRSGLQQLYPEYDVPFKAARPQ